MKEHVALHITCGFLHVYSHACFCQFEATILSELGIYGVQVKHGSTVVTNTTSGYLMRSKTSTSRETGINAGFGMLDSLQLVG